jgi:hypothetical protein
MTSKPLIAAAVLSLLVAKTAVWAQKESTVPSLVITEEMRAEARNWPYSDRIMLQLPQRYPLPPSAWQSTEKSFYSELISGGKFDVLVMPFQVQHLATDRSSRSLMAAQLAVALAEGGARIPDPYLVARALGEGKRQIPYEEAYALADRLGVKRVVWGFVGHDDGRMRLTIQYADRSNGPSFGSAVQLRSRSFDQLNFGDEQPPMFVFQQHLAEILKILGTAPSTAPKAKRPRSVAAIELPKTPFAMTRESPDGIRDAWYFQILAALTPARADRARERFAEKSLLALGHVSQDASSYRLLKARALLQLGLRVAAIKSLGEPKTPDERYLRAILDGNLPDAEKIAATVKSPASRLLAVLELNALRWNFGIATADQLDAAVDQLALPGDVWTQFVRRAMSDGDVWAHQDNVELKQLLDEELPIAGFALKDLAGGAVSVGNVSGFETTVRLSVLEHRRRLLQARSATICCSALQSHPGLTDYLDLLEAIGTDNLVRRARFLTLTQAAPQAGLEFVAKLETVYRDHPYFTLARSEAEQRLAISSSGAVRDGYLKAAYQNALNVMYWEQGQTPAAASAFEVFAATGRSDYGYVENFYVYDFPQRPFYPTWQAGGDAARSEKSLMRALQNSAMDAGPVRKLYDLLVELLKQPARFVEVEKAIDGRFRGNPEIALIRAETSAHRGDVAAAAAHYREGIGAQPQHWDFYLGLGKLLFENGQVAESARVFGTYPGFKSRQVNRVILANYAYEAGSLFFWSGRFAESRPLYRIAAELQTGADASMSSAIRINLMDGDYAAAKAGSLERARRYNSPYAYRDYLGMLHVTGQSEQAWNGFNTLIDRIDRPQIWETALVGHRIEGLSEERITAWAAQDSVRSAGQLHGYAAMYALRAGVTDRIPTEELSARIAKLERPMWHVDTGRFVHVVRTSRDGRIQMVLGPSSPNEGSILPTGVFEQSAKTRVKSDLLYFAEAYRALRLGDHAGASSKLEEASALYDPRNVQVGYLLPYFAFAAAKAGRADVVTARLEQFSQEYRRFDFYLAKAALSGLSGRVTEALEFLELAKSRRPFTEYRPLLSEYQMGEISEWLYEATGDPRFREFALAWARQNQTSQPWFAWSYAMEAKLATSAEDRIRAIAMAYYLDKNSHRLTSIPAADVKNAVEKYAARNPFLPTNEVAKRGKT